MTTLTAKIASAFAARADFSPPFQSESAPPAPIAPAVKSVNRRAFMNSIVALPIVAALPVAAPSIAAGLPTPADKELVNAANEMHVIDQTLTDLHRRYGDDADSREDYLELAGRRLENIATLITVPAASMAGIQAKASALRAQEMIEDYRRHRQIAVSLADDLVKDNSETNPPTFEPRQKSQSPVLAAIERQRDALELSDRLDQELEDAKDAVLEQHGRRPNPLIAWRNYSMIGGSEIDRARREFIGDGEDPKVIEQEYRDAKKRYRGKIKAGKDWDKALTKTCEESREELRAAEKALGTVKLSSVADAAAMIEFVNSSMEQFTELTDWEQAALGNASKFLSRHARGFVA
jgi:hypothetical protein